MTWRCNTVFEERTKFIQEVLNSSGQLTFEQICEKYNISPRIGYKWLGRFMNHGLEGLKDQSRARKTYPDKISPEIEQHIIDARIEYPTWGPKKLQILLLRRGLEPPSTGSIGNVLKRNNLSKPRKYRRHVAQTAPLGHCKNVNDIWMYDFKGYFKTGDGKICEPLTITDGYSRFLIKCEHMKRKRTIDVWEILKEAFLEYGLPLRMRSDNGPPFATTGVGRLSPLSIKLIKLGVVPEWIEPGCPQENGRHERFHGTLKAETASPPAKTLEFQILKMNQFREYYNNTRPHEALNFKTPQAVYEKSPRQWDGRLNSPEYSSEFEVRKVGKSGNMFWKNEPYFLSESLYGEYVGIKELRYGFMGVFYGPIFLGEINLDKGFKRV